MDGWAGGRKYATRFAMDGRQCGKQKAGVVQWARFGCEWHMR